MKIVLFALICATLTIGGASASEAPQKFIIYETPAPVPAVAFIEADGRPRSITDFKGKVVLLNIWATWCVSCREEMPTLDRLQAKLGGADFEVVALSIDRAGAEAVRSFYDEFRIERLALYIDDSGKANRTLGIFGLPTTLLIDRNGQEIGRLIGPAVWDSPEMIAFIQGRLSLESQQEQSQ